MNQDHSEDSCTSNDTSFVYVDKSTETVVYIIDAYIHTNFDKQLNIFNVLKLSNNTKS